MELQVGIGMPRDATTDTGDQPRSPSVSGRVLAAAGTDATPQKLGPLRAVQSPPMSADLILSFDGGKVEQGEEEPAVAASATGAVAGETAEVDIVAPLQAGSGGSGGVGAMEVEPSSSQGEPQASVSHGAQAGQKRAKAGPPKHRLARKTPKGLAGRVAELVCARTTDTAMELPGAALAECILQVTGPPNVTRSGARARHLLNWLRSHAKCGSARVCGRAISPRDVKEAAKMVGDVWSRKLIRLQRPKSKKSRSLRRVRTDSSTKSSIRDTSLFVVAPSEQPQQQEPQGAKLQSQASQERPRPRDGDRGAADMSSDGESDEGRNLSDLSDEEDVDSEEEEGHDQNQDDFIDLEEPLPDDGYLGDWSRAPELGCPTFNEFAAMAMRRAGVACTLPPAQLDKSAACPPLQPHQEAAIFLLHPKSPVSRLLVDHPTGSGKTREMIQVLDNFFYDKRPKVPVFPKEPVCRNFYAELMRWPSKYRDYFCCLRPHCAARAARCRDWRARRSQLWDISYLGDRELRAICKEMREVLEMKGCFYMGRMRRFWKDDFQNRFPEEPLPAAPLRALRYTSAGGRHTAIREEDGLPASALFKIGFSKDDPNVYSNKIVLMDEVHNLVRAQTQFGEQLTHLRRLLSTAKGAVLAGFTGTPILSEPSEGRTLLDIIKGSGAPLGDAGFISSFPMRPRSLFPRSFPHGVPDSMLTPKLRHQFVRKVPLAGESLQRYDKKRAVGLPPRRLQRYCNLCVHFGSLHDGKFGTKARVLDDLEACAPKLHAIAQDVTADSSKAVVLVARNSGMDALIAHLRRVAADGGGGPSFGVATMDELAAFNSSANLRGELYRVLVADSTQCGEGVSFFTVRRVLLADVPTTPSALVQAVGRSIRMYGHYGLPDDEWTVNTTLYAATLPRWMRSPLGAWALRAQRHHHDALVAQSKARRLLRKLTKVGIPSLEVLKERLSSFFPQEAKPEQMRQPKQTSQTREDDSMGLHPEDASTELPLSQATDSSASSSSELAPSASLSGALSSLSLPSEAFDSRTASQIDMNSSDADATAPQLAGTTTSPRQLKVEEVEKFLESIGLWDEAKQMTNFATGRAKMAKDSVGGAHAPRHARPPPRPLPSGTKPGRPVGRPVGVAGQPQQHYLVRALQWLVDADDVPQLSARMNLSTSSADEEAIKGLAAASRALVPALQELRREAIDRRVLESLVAGQADQLGGAEAESEGESSVCDFGISGASSGGEDAGPPPLVLPPNWQTEKVRRGKVIAREYVDPSGNRYKTEAQARKAVDALRRKANMALRLRQRFGARFTGAAAATDAGGVAVSESGATAGAESPEDKRQRLTV